MEEILVTDDWAEVLVAENLTLDLLLGNLMYREFNKEAIKQGDTHLSIMNLVILNKWIGIVIGHFLYSNC